MKDEFSEFDHLEILNNPEADFTGRIITFKQYVKMGYDIEKAKTMAGLKSYDFSKDIELQKFINEQNKKD